MTDLQTHLAKARAKRSANAKARAAAMQFALEWRSDGLTETINGLHQTALRIGLRPETIRSRISSGGGEFCIVRRHPITQEDDVGLVKLLTYQRATASRRGRPRKERIPET